VGEGRGPRQPEAQRADTTFEVGAAAGAGMDRDAGQLVDDEDRPS
jgi:hypothetical protein